MSNKIVCLCNFVSEREINKALLKGAKTIRDIQELTGASSSCGRCIPALQQMISAYMASSVNPQRQLF